MVKIFINKTNLLLILLFSVAVSMPVLSQKKIVGYYPNWINISANYFEFQNLTHVIQAFASVNTDGTISVPSGIPNSALIQAVHSADRKILISLGGGGGNTSGFVSVVSDSALMTNFINNVASFITQNKYDGVDIDWEFPNLRQGTQLTTLVKNLRQKFNTIDSALIISMAVPATASTGQGFQYSSLQNYVDWFAIMTYDYYGSWSSVAGFNAPLYQSLLDPLNAGAGASAVQYMISKNIPKNKLLFGIPFYGKEFKSAGLFLPQTGETDLLYNQVVDSLSTDKWIYYWDNTCDVPYLINDSSTAFITYDDTASVRIKTQYAVNQGLGGVMIWAIGQDMLLRGKQPLLESIGNVINGAASIVSNNNNIPDDFNLANNYPNPFNPSTVIEFSIPHDGFVTVKVFNTLGEEVAVLGESEMTAGLHKVSFNGTGFSSGIYFYVLSYNGLNIIKKMMLLK